MNKAAQDKPEVLTRARTLSKGPGEYVDGGLPYLRLYVSPKLRRTFGIYRWSPARQAPVRKMLGEYKGEDIEEIRKRARAAFEQIEAAAKERKEGRGPAQPERPPTLREFLTAYTNALKANPATGNAYWAERIFERADVFADWLNKPMESITPAMLDDRMTSIANRRGVHSSAQAAKAFKAVFTFARKRRGYRGEDIAAGLDVAESPQRTRVLDADERRRVIEALNDPSLSPWVRPFYRVLMLTGARRGNLATARWADMNLDAGEWYIPWAKSKNRKALRIRLRSDAVAILREWREFLRLSETLGEWVFPSIRNPKQHVVDPTYAWRKVVRIAGLERYATPHDLRRTFGSMLLRADVPMAVVRDALGHSSIAVTEHHYAFLNKKAIDSHIDRVCL